MQGPVREAASVADGAELEVVVAVDVQVVKEHVAVVPVDVQVVEEHVVMSVEMPIDENLERIVVQS